MWNFISVVMVSTDGKAEAAIFYSRDASFSIRWQHSVEKEDWEEIFVVKDDQIVLKDTRFKTFGAGVPNDAGKDTFIKDGWVYMTDIDQLIGKELAITTGRSTNHSFLTEDSKTPLSASKHYQISTGKISLWEAAGYFMTNRMR